LHGCREIEFSGGVFEPPKTVMKVLLIEAFITLLLEFTTRLPQNQATITNYQKIVGY